MKTIIHKLMMVLALYKLAVLKVNFHLVEMMLRK